MKNRNRSNAALIAGVVLLAIVILVVVSTVVSATTSTTEIDRDCLLYVEGECPAEHLDTLAPRATTSTSTTSTTIDLSFLNTTTTSTTVPQYRNTPTAALAVETIDVSDRWDVLAQCETGGNWSTNTGNGFGGGLQFAHGPGWSTWRAFGGEEFAPHPWDATREEQIVIAERVLASSGWGAWPGCSRRHGWR